MGSQSMRRWRLAVSPRYVVLFFFFLRGERKREREREILLLLFIIIYFVLSSFHFQQHQVHPADVGDAKKGKLPGYSVRIGEWKGVVPHCADQDAKQPSDGDAAVMQVYHLPSDPFEANDLAKTTGKTQISTFLTLLKSKNLTCSCYQC